MRLKLDLAWSPRDSSDYLFAKTANTGAGELPSDVASMATALGGPWFVWGAVVGLFSVLVLVVGHAAFMALVRFAHRAPRPARPTPTRA